jgi:predicted dehydrogenase
MRKDRWSRLETARIDSGDVHDHPYLPQFSAFVEAIREGRDMPHTSLREAFETHRVVFAADRSAAERRPVKMSELV